MLMAVVGSYIKARRMGSIVNIRLPVYQVYQLAALAGRSTGPEALTSGAALVAQRQPVPSVLMIIQRVLEPP